MKWSEDDEKQAGALEPGEIYPFEIVDAEEKTSKAGNPYINLKLKLFVEETERTVYDIIMPQMPSKLRSFCEARGLMSQFKSRSLTITDCSTGEGFVRLAKKLDKNDRVQVEAYLDRDPRGRTRSESDAKKPAPKPQTASAGDDGVPF